MTTVVSGTITINIGGAIFYAASVFATTTINGVPLDVVSGYTSTLPHTSSTTTIGPSSGLPLGPATLLIDGFGEGQISGTPSSATLDVNLFTADGVYFSGTITMVAIGTDPVTGAITFSGQIIGGCLHGSSLITTSTGLKRLDHITIQDQVLTGTGDYAPVCGVVSCPLQTPDTQHTAVIFEPGSLGKNLPTDRLIMDPGHPLALPSDFKEQGMNALKPANQYRWDLKSKDITAQLYQDLPEKTLRYDLVLGTDHHTYIANGMVIQSRATLDRAGYDHFHADLF